MRTHRELLIRSTVATFVVVIGIGGALAEGRCLSVVLDAPIQLPDGSVHPAGELTLCDSHAFSPSTSLHRTLVNGMPVAMLRSRRLINESSPNAPATMMFERSPEGPFRLIGYVVPSRSGSVTFRLGKPASVRVADRAGSRPGPSKVETVVLAARHP
jgi:hypothetical protein